MNNHEDQLYKHVEKVEVGRSKSKQNKQTKIGRDTDRHDK